MNQTKEQVAFRAKLWQLFVKEYQAVMAANPDGFVAYCAEFRERWIAGK